VTVQMREESKEFLRGSFNLLLVSGPTPHSEVINFRSDHIMALLNIPDSSFIVLIMEIRTL
jgi:hypothetical protein